MGDPKYQKEVFNERFQQISTRSMVMQMPYCLVSKVPTHDLMENSGSDLSILDKSPSPLATIDYQKTAQDIFIFFNLTFLKIFWMLA